MDNPIIQALRRARQAYMTNVGEPTAQLVGGGVRGYLGLDAPEYADSRGMEAYRNAAAISNTPVVGMPSMAVRAGAKAAPAIAQSLRKHAKGFQEYNRALGPAGASQMVVWHGSPHKFDAFDASKIGTGEGAQAYGHGLYLAESPGVARQYAENVKDMGAVQRINAELSQLSKIMASDEIPGSYRKYRTDAGREAAKRYDELMASRESVRQEPGQMYKVDLPDEKIERMLDWDKPLYRQAPNVRKAVRQVVDENTAPGTYAQWVRQARPDMRTLQNDMLEGMSNAEIAEALRKQGIPGIRYLDASSRGAGQGTSNFVVFPGEEAALTILERNNEIINALRKRKPD